MNSNSRESSVTYSEFSRSAGLQKDCAPSAPNRDNTLSKVYTELGISYMHEIVRSNGPYVSAAI
jgi:hypothetical protein